MRVPVLFLLLICYLKCINFNYKADLAHTTYTLALCSIFSVSSKLMDQLSRWKTIWRALLMINDAALTLIPNTIRIFSLQISFSIFQFEIKVLMFLWSMRQVRMNMLIVQIHMYIIYMYVYLLRKNCEKIIESNWIVCWRCCSQFHCLDKRENTENNFYAAIAIKLNEIISVSSYTI